jgi:hypothetical protein
MFLYQLVKLRCIVVQKQEIPLRILVQLEEISTKSHPFISYKNYPLDSHLKINLKNPTCDLIMYLNKKNEKIYHYLPIFLEF